MGMMLRSSAPNLTTYCIAFGFFVFLHSCSSFPPTEAYGGVDPNPNDNITIKWDVMNWTPDGYVAVVTIYNFQKHRSIQAPGWRLSWTWARKEMIWSTVGGQVVEQGDCSHFKGYIPTSCKKTPTIVDLQPGVPYNMQIAGCCKGGVLKSWSGSDHGDQANSISSFQISVGQAGNNARTVRLPRNFTFKAPAAMYDCRPAKLVRRTIFITPDKRRTTSAFKTWKVTCFYSGLRKSPGA